MQAKIFYNYVVCIAFQHQNCIRDLIVCVLVLVAENTELQFETIILIVT